MNRGNRRVTAEFLRARMAGHTHLLTVTLRPTALTQNTFDRRLKLEGTVHHFLHRLSRACFKRRHRRLGLRVGAFANVELGSSGDHVHAHITLECPPSVEYQAFENLILSSAKRCRTLGREIDLRTISSAMGLAGYLSKEGQESLLPLAIQDAKY